MDNNQFTTTFIPKKPMVAMPTAGAPVSRPVGLLSSLSLIFFFITLLVAGGIYAWEHLEKQKVAQLAEYVAIEEKKFEPQSILRLQALDKQLKNANLLVKNHTVVSPVFDLLESSTLKPVQFSKFELVNDDAKATQIKMSGIADGYRTIAQQSDVFGASSFLKNTIFSNFFLTPQSKVSFDLSFGVRPEFLDFETAPLSLNPEPTRETVIETIPETVPEISPEVAPSATTE